MKKCIRGSPYYPFCTLSNCLHVCSTNPLSYYIPIPTCTFSGNFLFLRNQLFLQQWLKTIYNIPHDLQYILLLVKSSFCLLLLRKQPYKYRFAQNLLYLCITAFYFHISIKVRNLQLHFGEMAVFPLSCPAFLLDVKARPSTL